MKTITYRFELTLAMPLAVSDDDVDFYTQETATRDVFRRDLEKSILHHLRKQEGDCDIECLDYEIFDDGEHQREREKYEDDGREYADPRDFRDGLE